MIGRKRETQRLDQCMEQSDAQLVAIYGRRRVGKTYLVQNYFNGRFDFKLTGIYGKPKEIQLDNFTRELKQQTQTELSTPSNWMDAFTMLRKYLSQKPNDEKTIVFLDEMPWMDTIKSDFLQSFEWFWNGWASAQKNFICIVCGSATSWMRENIDENKGGLYNRLTCRIYLEPFTLNETEEYLSQKNITWSRYDITECYMIMGGIPYYLSLLSPDLTYNANIDNLFFRKRAELWDEFPFLYETLFQNSHQYIKIVEALSQKRSGLFREEVIERTKLPNNGLLTKMLSNLEHSGFIRINDVFGSKQKRYQLADYYTLFYFRFIRDNFGKDEHFWSNTLGASARYAWAGLTFEQVCKDHINQIKKKLGISGVLSSISVWDMKGDDSSPGTQIDLIIDRRDHVTNLCEIKFSTGEYEIDKDYDLVLRNKIETFHRHTKTKNALQLVMITTYGLKNNKYHSIASGSVTMEDLFEKL